MVARTRLSVKAIPHVFVGGVKTAIVSRADLAKRIVRSCLERRRSAGRGSPQLLFDTNGQGVSLAARSPDYKQALDVADIVHADGGWIVLASRFLSGDIIPERSATTDMIHDVVAAGLESGIRHYLLGSTEEVNGACARRLAELHPGIVIAGRHHGFFGPKQEDGVIAAVNAADADVVWIGLGKPREQLFAVAAKNKLRASWLITCGGCFNYITGHYRRAPRWMQDYHLEWLFRAATTPSLIWRYATTSPHAIWLALTRRDRRIVSG